MDAQDRPELSAWRERQARTLDEQREEARAKRHAAGYRTARENLQDLVDPDSFLEYGQLAVAAQRNRRDYLDLQSSTAADGILTGTCTINVTQLDPQRARAAVIINDYSVLAGTQGFFHHKKLDRICELARELGLPLVMYTEGGGGRPGDTDVSTQIAGLNILSFSTWAALEGVVPRIAVNNGYCFAGNAALFGCADFTIATRNSWIGMAGPAMIEGGGMGKFAPTSIGPIEVQEKNGVVDIVAADEAHATALARQLLGYFQGSVREWTMSPQEPLRDVIPQDRRWAYPVRRVIETIADDGSFMELRRVYGRSIITGFVRLEGRPLALIANDCQQLGGAIDSESAEKAARFLRSCEAFGLPVLSLTDTPGFMVGPDSEAGGAVRRLSSLFLAGAKLSVPVVAIFLRKGYGLGAMAMTGGSFLRPVYAASWPTGEFGGMGLEGAVRLGYKKELEAVQDQAERESLFQQLLARMYDIGKASEAASHLEIDAVIDPAETRAVILRALASSGHQYHKNKT
jgi:acetyl-CoA carboxylase carboxyltransferase component